MLDFGIVSHLFDISPFLNNNPFRLKRISRCQKRTRQKKRKERAM